MKLNKMQIDALASEIYSEVCSSLNDQMEKIKNEFWENSKELKSLNSFEEDVINRIIMFFGQEVEDNTYFKSLNYNLKQLIKSYILYPGEYRELLKKKNSLTKDNIARKIVIQTIGEDFCIDDLKTKIINSLIN
jgi:hypothetical protein